ncbi:MAG: sigma-70 family RNA polymerase sigma factor [Planctomycetota bacterium]
MNEHLSQIDTLWSVIRRAHDSDTNAESAQRQLLERYSGAIRRYLHAKLRDPAAADDVYQDFALKFVRGDFKNVTPEKGRFRTFIRTVLFRMVADHFRGKKRDKAVQLDEQVFEPASTDDQEARDEEFVEVWRDEMLKNAWDGLWELEKSSGKRWFTVLQLRVKNPEMRSADLAEALSSELDKPISTANVRVLLHRAREKFSGLLIDTVAESLNSRSYHDVEEELADLRLLEFCQASLEQLKAEQKSEE